MKKHYTYNYIIIKYYLKMKVITAVEKYKPNYGDITVFLAGGITDCDNWQKRVIDYLISTVMEVK